MLDKILIVDDDLETLRLVGLMLQKQGYQVLASNNGAQALSQARAEKPDLIILDVMMPNMDGYEVTRQLRAEPETSGIAILMFSAKSQVEDKVIGYEAGVDDYLTKPVHPVELVARVKALLGRGKNRAPAAPANRGYAIGVLGPKGGLGVSSLVLNLGISLYQKTHLDLILAELRPGQGAWGVDLGFVNPSGLGNLLRLKPMEVTAATVEKELVRTTYGIRLLLASNRRKELELIGASLQMEAILHQLPLLSSLVFFDLGAGAYPNYDKLLSMCDELVVVTEPYPTTITHSKLLLDDLAERGFGKSRLITLVIVNRVRADVQLSVTQVQDRLGYPIAQIIPPAPEQAFQAGMRNVPLAMIQPEGMLAQQFARLAELFAQRVKK